MLLLASPAGAQAPAPAAATPPAEPADVEPANGDPKDEANFPYLIPVKTWVDSTGFKRGDGVTITSVRGTLPQLKVGGTYRVEGTYQLGEAAVGQVALSIDTSGHGTRVSVPISRLQFYDIEKGRGTFVLVKKLSVPGKFRVALNYAEPGQVLKKDATGKVRSYGPSRGSLYFDQR